MFHVGQRISCFYIHLRNVVLFWNLPDVKIQPYVPAQLFDNFRSVCCCSGKWYPAFGQSAENCFAENYSAGMYSDANYSAEMYSGAMHYTGYAQMRQFRRDRQQARLVGILRNHGKMPRLNFLFLPNSQRSYLPPR